MNGVAFCCHQFNELLATVCNGHGIVDGNGQPKFPTLTALGTAVFSGRHLFVLVRFCFRRDNRQTVFQTQLVRCLTQTLDVVAVRMIFISVFKTNAVHNEVRMDMISVGVSSNEYLVAGKHLLCESQSDFVCGFGCQLFIGVEGLCEVIEHSLVCLSVLHFRIHEFLKGRLGYTVNTRYQFPTVVHCFAVALAVGENECQSCPSLRATAF